MNKGIFSYKPICRRWVCAILALLSMMASHAQTGGEKATEELVNLGFENVRWTETENERIYTIENNVYKAQGVGIAKAIEIIQKNGLPADKTCKVIVTHLEVPELALTYQPVSNDTTNVVKGADWQTSFTL